MHDLLVQFAGYVVPWIEIMGILVVLWGVLEALAALVRRGWAKLAGRAPASSLASVRFAMGEKLVLGLEFFLAGDIIQTIVVPTLESLAILAGIVLIRTVIVYFLNLEMRQESASREASG
jgi:uncharacterized membrane protein